MANKNVPRKSVHAQLLLDASESQSPPAISTNHVVADAFEFDESYIMSRRPTRLSLVLLSRAKEGRTMPEAQDRTPENEVPPQQERNIRE